MTRASTEDTDWESLLKTVIQSLIRSFPDIIRNGVHSDGINVPPYTNKQVRDVSNFDTKQNPPLCPILYLPTETTHVDAVHNRLNGLDTVSLYAPITFPVQDRQMSIPLLFQDVTLSGSWHSYTPCKNLKGTGITAEHYGTFLFHFQEVQLTLTVDLDTTLSEAVSVQVKLTDLNQKWSSQPALQNITFESSTTQAQQTVVLSLMQSDVVMQQFRDPAKQGLEGEELSKEILSVINQMLAKIMDM
ncbi:hypothetical protein [Paenibacillus gansuensis]|uniref:Uncharacterized protein n=1 Tax=Paenibacillus gansuensis TaxID=306542 RepID=A0ABW5P6I6_9BACL